MQQKDESRLLEYQIASFPLNSVFLKIREIESVSFLVSARKTETHPAGENDHDEKKYYSQPMLDKITPMTSDVKGKGASLFVQKSFWNSAWVAGMPYATLLRISGLSLLLLVWGLSTAALVPLSWRLFMSVVFSSPASSQKPLCCSLVGDKSLEMHIDQVNLINNMAHVGDTVLSMANQ